MTLCPRAPVLAAVALALTTGCRAGDADDIILYVDTDRTSVFARYLMGTPGRPGLAATSDPVGKAEAGLWDGVLTEDVRWPGETSAQTGPAPAQSAAGIRTAMQVAIVEDLACTECYEISGAGRLWTIHAGDVLGAQYGLTQLLESWGYRFFHPFAAYRPETLSPDDGPTALTTPQAPEIERRGLHLHTLHPIEALDAFWLPSARSTERALRILDWAIKSRANHVQWVSLDDITDNATTAERWRDHTSTIVDVAHEHGLTTGLGIQLFGESNLQQAFDLIDGDPSPEDRDAMMEERLELVTGVGFDELNLSFGEFFNADPDLFVETVDRSYEIARSLDPDVAMSTVVHVGNSESQKVVYDGQEMIYYFLAQYVNPEIKPWVHTTMYYNLFEDAGGAYHHEEFDEHRDLLIDRINDDQPVGYFPETAYWVAFDDSVPMYLPLYLRSRWLDLDRIRAATTGSTGLQDHVLFSTGWEWGYWQNDYTALRLSWGLQDWETETAQIYAPFGQQGSKLSDIIVAVANLQHRTLIEQRLTPYLAGRDIAMEAGFSLGIVAQPDRLTLQQLQTLDPAQLGQFEQDVVRPLLSYADALNELGDSSRALSDEEAGNLWFDEVADSIQVTHLRARFAHTVWSAALAHARGESVSELVSEVDTLLSSATTKVRDRHRALWDPEGARMVADEWDNPTIYQYGYLHHADSLCYWQRERAELLSVLELSDETPPGCLR